MQLLSSSAGEKDRKKLVGDPVYPVNKPSTLERGMIEMIYLLVCRH